MASSPLFFKNRPQIEIEIESPAIRRTFTKKNPCHPHSENAAERLRSCGWRCCVRGTSTFGHASQHPESVGAPCFNTFPVKLLPSPPLPPTTNTTLCYERRTHTAPSLVLQDPPGYLPSKVEENTMHSALFLYTLLLREQHRTKLSHNPTQSGAMIVTTQKNAHQSLCVHPLIKHPTNINQCLPP